MPRRSLAYVAAWIIATSCGVAVSWAGVRGVLYTAAVSPPAPVSVPSSSASATPSPATEPSTPSPTPSPSRTTATTKPRQLPPTTKSPAPSETGDVKSYTLRGGHVALAFFPHRIKFISATPDPGWETDVFDDARANWLRVEFHRDRAESAIIGMWDDGSPRVRFSDR